MSVKTSAATENFIKTVYMLEQGIPSDTRLGTVARELGITNAAATDMARKLAKKKFVDYEKYKALKLTSDGRKMALGIIRRHRLWETFLHRVLGMDMHEIHKEAEVLEHVTSDFLAEEINSFLGEPTIDPHGDPIPDAQGKLYHNEDNQPLCHVMADRGYEIVRLTGSEREYFEFCKANGLNIGSGLNVINQYQANKMTEIEVEGTKILLNRQLSGTIHVREVTKKNKKYNHE